MTVCDNNCRDPVSNNNCLVSEYDNVVLKQYNDVITRNCVTTALTR